jgi:hypothetical protein
VLGDKKIPAKLLWQAKEATLKQTISTAPRSLNRIGGFATHGCPCCAFSMAVKHNYSNKTELICTIANKVPNLHAL